MTAPAVVTPQEWEAASQRLLVKKRRRLARATRWSPSVVGCPGSPWIRGTRSRAPEGAASLLDLFDGRRQLIIYRAFFDPGVHGQPPATAGVERGRAYFITGRGDEARWVNVELSGHDRARTPGELGGLAAGLPAGPAV